MFDWLHIQFVRFCLWIAQRHPIMESIPRIGPGSEKVNSIVVQLGDDQQEIRFTFHNLTKRGAVGSWHASARAKPLRLELFNHSLVKATRLRITHYYGREEHRIDSWGSFIWAWVTAYAWRYSRWDSKQQRQFNRAALHRRERLDVLRLFVEMTLEDEKFKVGPSRLLSLLYTSRWIRHPNERSMLNYYDLLLQSLAEAGDLVQEQYGYRITAQGFGTLAESERDDRRHQDNIRMQSRIGWLTAALVFIGIVQVLAQVLSWAFPTEG